MNLRFLRTVIAVSQHRSLNAAAQSLGLSHSAVSLQIKTLEEELQFTILDRSKRPPILTGEGMALVEQARRMEDIASDIQALADSKRIVGRAILGAAPSMVQSLMAPSLAQMHEGQPDLKIGMVTASSQSLIDMVLDGTVHAALVTDPVEADPNLALTQICAEPYRVITSLRETQLDPQTLLRQRPYIWFDRRTRLSRDVEAQLIKDGIKVNSSMEVDSFEGVEALVRHNLGVSILPVRALSEPPKGVRLLPFGTQDSYRNIVVASRVNSPRRHLVRLFVETLGGLFNAPSPSPLPAATGGG